MSEDKLPTDRHPVLRVVPMPMDTNAAGDIFGGWIMSHADIAGSVVAGRRARGRIVTVAVNALQFRSPVFVNDLVSFYADVVRVGRSSITVEVVIYAERAGKTGTWEKECVRVTEATLTYVAIDEKRRPREVPPEQN